MEEEWIAYPYGANDESDRAMLLRLKRAGFSDWQLGDLKQLAEENVRTTPPSPRVAARVQDCRHLRRRISVEHAVPLFVAGTMRARRCVTIAPP